MGHILSEAARHRHAALNFGARLALAFALAFALAACHSLSPVDTAPLDHAGMGYDAIQQAKALRVTALEVASLARARQSGLSDATCVTLLQLSRGRGQAFDEGDTVAGLAQAGMSEQTVVELAKLNQLGLRRGRAAGDAPRRSFR